MNAQEQATRAHALHHLLTLIETAAGNARKGITLADERHTQAGQNRIVAPGQGIDPMQLQQEAAAYAANAHAELGGLLQYAGRLQQLLAPPKPMVEPGNRMNGLKLTKE